MGNQRFKHQRKNREPTFAGKFYPATKNELISQLKELFSEAKEIISTKKPRVIIAPHAGYVFSGRVAASAYNQIPEDAVYERVFILASSHQFLFNSASIFDSGNYETPMGEVKVDIDLAQRLIEANEIFTRNPDAHQYEHSLEVQLPFLQYKLGNNFLLVPIILGTNEPSDCEKIAKALEPWFTPKNLFVVSTDFSHYPSYEDAVENDLITARAICKNQPQILLQVLEENKRKKISHLATSLCGWTSVVTLLYITGNKNLEFQKIDYQNSGDNEVYGDKDRVVGYWALAVHDKEESFSFSKEEQKELLEKARNAIVQLVKNGRRISPEPPKTQGVLNNRLGAFVSIYINGELRGCIGNFAGPDILNDLVQRIAVAAACDYRFEGLKPEELDYMELEISILSPLKRIKSIDEIEPGKHGIFIKKGINSGTFLPQVAKKAGWNVEDFLGHCSRDKAGIGWEGWKDAELFTYEAFIFRG